MTSQFDELNILNTDSQEITRSIPYEEYFGEMDITDKQKEERIAIAKDFEGMALFLMALFAISGAFSHSDRDFIKKQAKQAYLDVLERHNATSDSMREHAQDFARDFVRTTTKNANDAWYQSEDRARLIAENEANVAANNADYEQALAEGKTHKRWITMNDARVRHTHRDVNGKMIPIGEAFYVGASMMMYPKDDSMGASASEIANCRCGCRYYYSEKDEDVLTFKTEGKSKETKLLNVTEEYRSVNDGASGSPNIQTGYRTARHEPEIQVANWIQENFGGEITILKESDEYGVKMPDYLWNGKYWELKTISTAKAADSAVRKAAQQIQGNAGGIVLNLSEQNIDMKDLKSIVYNRLNRTNLENVDVIVLRDNALLEVFRYKK